MQLQITEFNTLSPEELVDRVLRGTGFSTLEVELAQQLMHALDQIRDLQEDAENTSQGDNTSQTVEVAVGNDA